MNFTKKVVIYDGIKESLFGFPHELNIIFFKAYYNINRNGFILDNITEELNLRNIISKKNKDPHALRKVMLALKSFRDSNIIIPLPKKSINCIRSNS